MNNETENRDSNSDQGFSESWLTLREPADHAARSHELLLKLQAWRTRFSSFNVVELGAGTGSNLRYLLPQLGHDQQWLLLDNDATLLERLPALLGQWVKTHNATIEVDKTQVRIRHDNFSAAVGTRLVNLATRLDSSYLQDTQLLTGSALLDLTSAPWLDKLSAMSQKSDCACLFALNYNGRIEWQPALPSDSGITDLLNQHQLGDKGFGPALGPNAGEYFARQLKAHKSQVMTAQSDWVINPSMIELQRAIVDGWAMAAKEQNINSADTIEAWLSERCALIENTESTLRVGHVDVLALP